MSEVANIPGQFNGRAVVSVHALEGCHDLGSGVAS